MLIVCPSCASEYMIDPGRIGAEGRTVRCAGCKETWFVTRDPDPVDQPTTANDTGPERESKAAAASFSIPDEREIADSGLERDDTASGQEPGRAAKGQFDSLAERGRQIAAAPVLVAASIVILASALLGRSSVVRTFPGTAGLYASIGLPVNLRGLEFRAVRSELVATGADTFLVVEGEIANISGRDAPVPPIEIAVRGAEGQMLYTWTNDPPRETMAASDTSPFRARLAAPPAEGRHVLVRFAGGDKTAAAGHPE
jgi:predicted Zn finger-like uncharacterized protein